MLYGLGVLFYLIILSGDTHCTRDWVAAFEASGCSYCSGAEKWIAAYICLLIVQYTFNHHQCASACRGKVHSPQTATSQYTYIHTFTDLRL